MEKPSVSIICALSLSRVIGENGKMPWHIPEDLKNFKQITTGHAVIMGRKTFESIGCPLPDRMNIVITGQDDFSAKDIAITHSIDESLEKAYEIGKNEVFVIGGAEIYKQIINKADKLYLTVIEDEIEGDTFFPDYSEFKKVVSERKSSDENYKYTFLELER